MTDIDLRRLLAELPGKRWFGGKGRGVSALELIDAAVLDDPPGDSDQLVDALVRVAFDEGASQLYHLPLLLGPDGVARDALDEPARLGLLGRLMAQGQTVRGARGTFRFGGPGLDPMAPPGDAVRVLGAEQSNSSLVLDDAVIVKLFRRVEPGPNPELELNRALTAEGFEHVPAHVGEAQYEGTWDDEEVTIDLAIAQVFVHGASDGWGAFVNHVRAVVDQIHDADLPEDRRFLTEERAAPSLEAAERLGDATAALHVALAREELAPELAPEPIDASDLKQWAESAHVSLRRLVRAGDHGLGALEEEIETRLERLTAIADAGLKTRVHGDFHLGQVIRTPDRWLILDFEGEPLRPLDVRRAKQSPLRDVAGMLRSFSYAAAAVLLERSEPGSEERTSIEPWTETWEELVRARYLHAYLRSAHEGRFLPERREDLAVLLDVFEIDKALYEIDYERTHRPDWVGIPLHGIRKVIERGTLR